MATGVYVLIFSAALLLANAAPPVNAPTQPVIEVPQPVARPVAGPDPAPYWQVIIERHVTIRVPAQRSPLVNFTASPEASQRSAPPPIAWKEKNAPKCVAMRSIVGMQVRRDSIDLITRQNQRLRARLNRGCRALDFYSGFYMQANKDGQLCEDRDPIHARSGAECEIDKFHLMVPVRDDD